VPSHKSISSNFGARWGRHHDGIDIPARKGTHIVSVSDGVVVYAGSGLGGYGNLTVISHRNGLFSVYAHSDKLYTTKGQKVHKGQVIATVGSTGRSTGNHLHFEIRKNSNPVDPKKVFARNK
jgi:murein DD-endopeptidase MepM/ murein hydrolase activator NlpD